MSDEALLERWMRRGLGRAVLFLRERDARTFRELILDGCAHNWTYDKQLEEHRGQYMYDILQATGEPEWYAPHIRHLLLTAGEEESTVQLFDLAGRMAQDGDPAMRETMQAAFAHGVTRGDITGAEEIIALDGVQGYVFVARFLMQHPLPEDELWREHGLLDDLEQQMGQEQARAALEAVPQEGQALRAYVEEVRRKWAEYKAREKTGRTTSPPSTYEDVRRRIEDPDRLWGTRWMADADDEIVRRLAEDLLAETDPERLRKYLRLFAWRAFPLDPARLIALAREAAWPFNGLAVRALFQVVHPAVRALGLEFLQNAEDAGVGVGLLAKNYEAGDYARMATAVYREQTSDDLHSLGLHLGDFIEAHPEADAIPLLLHFYEEGPCGMCRLRAIKSLAGFGSLPGRMHEECRWDAYEGIREFIAKVEAGSQ